MSWVAAWAVKLQWTAACPSFAGWPVQKWRFLAVSPSRTRSGSLGSDCVWFIDSAPVALPIGWAVFALPLGGSR